MQYGQGLHIAPVASETSSGQRAVESYEKELKRYRRIDASCERLSPLVKFYFVKKRTIQNQALLRSEAEHRLLNDLQIIGSLLSLQGRTTANAEAASQLAAAADRIATIGRIHRRLHSLEGVTPVAFKKLLEGLCGDFASMVSSGLRGERDIDLESVEIELPTVTCRPLGFIANELNGVLARYDRGLWQAVRSAK